MKSRTFNFLKNLGYGLLVCVLFFTLLEVILYAAGIDYRQRNLKFQNKFNTVENAPELPVSYQEQIPLTVWHNLIHNELCYPDVDYIFKVKGNPSGKPIMGYEGINAQGFRGDDFEVEAGWKRIMVLGNSCVFGWELPQLENTFPYKLEQKLNAKGQEYKVFNLGQPGYSSTQCLKLYKEWRSKINPDIVIIYMGWNDVWPTPWLTDKQTMQALKVNNTWVARQLRKMRTYSLMQKLIGSTSTKSDTTAQDRVRVPVSETGGNLKQIMADDKVIIVLPPYCKQERDIIKPYREMVTDVFTGAVPIIKLDSMEIGSPNSSDYFNKDGFHPNVRGAEYIANRLLEEITE